MIYIKGQICYMKGQIYVIWKAKFMSNLCYMNGQICYMKGQIYVIWKAKSMLYERPNLLYERLNPC